MKLHAKKAIITGASRSIGRAIAIAYAKEGADIIISYRSDEEGALQTVAEIEHFGRKAKALYANFSDTQHVKDFFKKSLNFLGQVDLLVNNAATYDTTEFLKLPIEDFDESLRVGVVVPMLLTQLAAQQMIEKKIQGLILNISSITGVRPYPNRVALATTKSALNMLTQSCALELGKFNIRVNAIAPGCTPYDRTESMKSIPLQRTGTPEDHANAAVFLASDEASWITGQILSVDGGHSLSHPS